MKRNGNEGAAFGSWPALATEGARLVRPAAGRAIGGKIRHRPATHRHRPATRLRLESLEARQLLAADIVINEINYDYPDKTVRAEYIELFNNGDQAADLSGWYFSDGVQFSFPNGSSLGPGEYLLVAEDPLTIRNRFGVSSLGPWTGKLSNDGETITLRDAGGAQIDEVDYQLGYPWPTVGDEPGYSIELIHPGLDNSLGGSWRHSTAGGATSGPLIAPGSQWQYFRGTSSPGGGAADWRAVGFDASSWLTGETPLGYGENFLATSLPDMRGNYTSVYLRHEFQVDDPAVVGQLDLSVLYDDGINVWINGQHVASDNVRTSDPSFDATAISALENLDFVSFPIAVPEKLLVAGTNVMAIQLLNASISNSSDAFIDPQLEVAAGGGNSTPGAVNSAFADNAPPQSRQVSHGAGPIVSDQAVSVTVKVTDPDGVASVALQYQVVEPGDYFGRFLKAANDGSPRLDPRYDQGWTTIAMQDDGSGPDQTAGDDLFSALIPAAVNQHRRLVRYRMVVEDRLGASVQIPYADDPAYNFAYYVYDGPPTWTGSARPGVAPEVTYDFAELPAMATYQLLTTADQHQDAQHIPDASTGGYAGSEYLWTGTLVYHGQVYDQIRYRARGGVWRYSMGKNMWKFDFNRGHGFQADDDYGRPYATTWDKLNLSAVIQQGNYLHRGEQGLFESVGFRLFDLAGVPSSNTNFVHFRIVENADQTGSDQFSGDFQGIYLAVEQLDGNMLDEHELPDGNLYKIENYQGTANNQGPTQPSDASDVASFIATYRNTNPSAEWWEANLDLEEYFSYQTIAEAIHHYDTAYGKNYFYYHNPETGRFEIIPWDLDLTWANNMYGSGDHDFKLKVANNPDFNLDYQNRVREVLDLLYNEEQTGMLIDEVASLIYAPGQASWVDADRAMWDYNPIMASSYVNPDKAGYGRFYESAATKDFAGMLALVKNYVRSRGRFMETNILRSTRDEIPVTPLLTYIGTDGYPLNELRFETSAFQDPQGAETFAAMQWRLAAVTDPNSADFDSATPRRYEIDATWESGELTAFTPTVQIPFAGLQAGSTYRARVRVKDVDGHWSHWSEPVQFEAAEPAAAASADVLRISEVHYHPAQLSAAEVAAGFDDVDEFEFLELVNISDSPIELNGVVMEIVNVNGQDEGVSFDFSSGAITSLAPQARLVIVENLEAFQLRYGTGLPVAGQYVGKLGNGGETVTMSGNGSVIQQFAYDDAWYPETDGQGYSLEIIDPRAADLSSWNQASAWRVSSVLGGTPGVGETPLRGDFNGDRVVDVSDLDLLRAAVRTGDTGAAFDLTADGSVSIADVVELVEGILHTFMGDANLDGEVNFTDFVILANNFATTSPAWSHANFDTDEQVAFSDFVLLANNFGRKREVAPAAPAPATAQVVIAPRDASRSWPNGDLAQAIDGIDGRQDGGTALENGIDRAFAEGLSWLD